MKNLNKNVTFQRNVRLKANLLKNKTKQNKRARNTTVLVIAVCILNFLVEFPQAVLLFLSILNFEFFIDIYKPLGDFIDLIVLTNYSIKIWIYFLISKEFRKKINSILKEKKLITVN